MLHECDRATAFMSFALRHGSRSMSEEVDLKDVERMMRRMRMMITMIKDGSCVLSVEAVLFWSLYVRSAVSSPHSHILSREYL